MPVCDWFGSVTCRYGMRFKARTSFYQGHGCMQRCLRYSDEMTQRARPENAWKYRGVLPADKGREPLLDHGNPMPESSHCQNNPTATG